MIRELINALKAGEELKNSETLKNVQATTAALVTIAGAGFMVLGWVGVDLNVTTEQLTAIAGGVATIIGMFNSYSTIATSKRVGVSTRGKNPAQPDTRLENRSLG